MGDALEKTRLTTEAYFDWEAQNEIRHEYYRGEVFAMAGGTLNHNELIGNMRRLFEDEFRGRGCRVFAENVKLEVSRNEYYPYPDVMVTCHGLDQRERYVVRYPSVLVDVISKNSDYHDRVFKWERYQQLPSLQYYLLVSQYETKVELYGRTDEPNAWTYHVYDQPEQVVELSRLDYSFPLSALYEHIEFLEPEGND
ncbi:Uma2 family endonuclease [Rhabdobacter roseus]|uniref:Uma2 family endonuclease n=1 Tax=Rhabdobacter roseus TaxID=1655419 RepID=A0A840TVK6_9BACT|nr:Uma2 family endonuclease [Rhabdobacter roseus]MBB5285657.1 Uma2 family endonuclease [Rhabdobacter roseus]